MNISICKLKPKTSLHLGEKEAILETTEAYLHSDTVFSAFCNIYRLAYGKKKLEELLTLFLDDPPFLVSSAFPYQKDELFFPIPRCLIFREKWAKRIEFVSQIIFEKLCRGEEIEEYLKQSNLYQKGQVLKSKRNGEDKYIWSVQEVPRVTLDSITSSSQIYHFGEVKYANDSGIYFLIEYRNASLEKEFKTIIRILADEGIGGDRSSGKGLFEEPQFDEITLSVPDSASHFITLSLYLPLRTEISGLEDAYYDLVERKGWIYSLEGRNMRRKSVRMFKEGSIFKEKQNKGKLEPVTPDEFIDKHKVYRYGYAFKIPYKLR